MPSAVLRSPSPRAVNNFSTLSAVTKLMKYASASQNLVNSSEFIHSARALPTLPMALVTPMSICSAIFSKASSRTCKSPLILSKSKASIISPMVVMRCGIPSSIRNSTNFMTTLVITS